MTTTSLIGTWVLAGTGLLFLLVFVGTGYRLYRKRRRLYYKRLPKINRILGWSRIGFMVLGLAAAVRVAMRGANYQTYLIAPCAWAVVVLIGVTLTDFFLFGCSRYSTLDRPKVRISVVLPWLLILLLLLLLALVRTAMDWGQKTAATDQRSHVFSWVIDGNFGWGIRTPYPGTHYTTPLLYCVPAVLVVGLAAMILVLIRRAWIPTPKYAALDEGFRARTIRDIVLICAGAVSPALAMMGLDIAWAYATIGPGSTNRAIVVAIAFFVGAWNLGQTFWIFANLIFLPPVKENQRLAEEIRVGTQAIHITGELMEPIPPIEIAEPITVPEVIEVEVGEVPEVGEASEVGEVPEVGEPEVDEVPETVEPEVVEPEGETEVAEPEGEAEVEPEVGGEVAEIENQAAVTKPEPEVAESEGEEPVEGEPEPVETPEPESVPEESPVPREAVLAGIHPTTVVPVRIPQPMATHRPGFKPKKKKPRRH